MRLVHVLRGLRVVRVRGEERFRVRRLRRVLLVSLRLRLLQLSLAGASVFEAAEVPPTTLAKMLSTCISLVQTAAAAVTAVTLTVARDRTLILRGEGPSRSSF